MSNCASSRRVIHFNVYTENLTQEDLVRSYDYLYKYKHPDLPLNINIIYEGKYPLEAIFGTFQSIPQTFFHIESSDYSQFSLAEKNIIKQFFARVVFNKQDNYREFDEDLAYFTSIRKDTWVNYLINESNTSLNDFKTFYDIIGIHNTYRIQYFDEYKDKKSFIKKLVQEYEIILRKDSKYLYNYENTTYHTVSCAHNGIITHKKYSGIDIWDPKQIPLLSELQTEPERCNGCIIYPLCKGGDYTVFNNTNNADLFCASNQALALLRNKENNA